MATVQPSAFGELLKRYRVAAGLSQEALAERAGLSARAISDLERGARRVPRHETVDQLATALALLPAARTRLEAAVVRWRAPAPLPEQPADRPGCWLPVPLTSLLGRDH